MVDSGMIAAMIRRLILIPTVVVLTVVVLTVVASTRVSDACQIPVFRYALERWPPDNYRVVVFHRDALQDELAKELAALSKATDDGARANLDVAVVDLSKGDPDPEFEKLWSDQKNASLPWMVLEYPERGQTRPRCWAGALDVSVVRSLRQSPAREEIAKRLRGGDSAVWVFLDSGNEQKDSAAWMTLETDLARLQKELKLPDLEAIVADASYVPENKIELRLWFSTVRVARSSEAEKPLVRMLLGTESDLFDFNEPMAFPVFGRGRVLPALIGKGINRATIRDACVYLIGACSCQVKEENPGIDLLMSAPWEKWVGRRDEDLKTPEVTAGETIDLILDTIPDPSTDSPSDNATPPVAGDATGEPAVVALTSPEATVSPSSSNSSTTAEVQDRAPPETLSPTTTDAKNADEPSGSSSDGTKRVWPLLAVIAVILVVLAIGSAKLRKPAS